MKKKSKRQSPKAQISPAHSIYLSQEYEGVMAPKTDGTFGNALGQVEPCDCGGVNLVIGPMTLHFALDEALALGELVDAARRIVQSERSGVAQASGKRHPRGLLH